VLTKKVVKQMAPDTTAQIFWLKNRQPDKWRDKKEIDANVTAKMSIDALRESLKDYDEKE